MRPGQILAVIGPSGAGKTTLFNVLAKRNKDYDVTGHLELNGHYYDTGVLRTMSGFVWQDALYHSHMTPKEALSFAAKVKLPSSLSKAERKERVDSLLQAFDLEKCANTKIGGDTIKGISGGEKKRLSIAVEVLSKPKLLFLDEPTSGLDATSAYRIMSLIRLLADAGTTVVTTLHQPRPAIARSIDRFLVLSAGHQVYFGPMLPMMEHFKSLGFDCPAGENPLDYTLDLINTEREEQMKASGENLNLASRTMQDLLQVEAKKNAEFVLEPLPSAVKEGQTRAELAAELAQTFRESSDYDQYLQATPEDAHMEEIKVQGSGFQSTWLTRFVAILWREFIQKIRNPQVAGSQIMGACLMGTIMGSFYYQIPPSDSFLTSNALAFVVMFSVFFSFHLVLFFPKERHIFLRDFSQGIMGSSEYYFSLAISDLPVTTLSATIFATIFYFMVGLRIDPASTFGVFLGCIILCSITGAGMLLTLGAFAPDVATANTFVSIVFLFAMFLNGYFSQSPVAWTWIETINYLRFMTMALFQNQWTGLIINCTTPLQCLMDGNCTACTGNSTIDMMTNCTTTCLFDNGDDVLTGLNVPPGVTIGQWCGYTICVLVVFHFVGLMAVSFLYNSRIENWIKKRKEKNKEVEYEKTNPQVVIGIDEEIFASQSHDLNNL